MQQVMTAEPAQTQFYAMAATRRDEQLGWLNEQAAVVVPEPAAASRDAAPAAFAATTDRPSVVDAAGVALPAAEPSLDRSAPSDVEQPPADTATLPESREADANSRDRPDVTGGARVDPAVTVAETAGEITGAVPSGSVDGGPPLGSLIGSLGGALRVRNVPAPKEDPRNEAQRSASLETSPHNDSVSSLPLARPHFRPRRPVHRRLVRRFHQPTPAPAPVTAEPSSGLFSPPPNP